MNELESDMKFLEDLLTLYQVKIRINEDKEISADRKIEILKQIRFEKNLLLKNLCIETGEL